MKVSKATESRIKAPTPVSPGNLERIDFSAVKKIYRDYLVYHNRDQIDVDANAYILDLENPTGGRQLVPGEKSPVCVKCNLFNGDDCKHPFLEPTGSEDPLLTVVYEAVSPFEDDEGLIGQRGVAGHMRSLLINELSKYDEINIRDVRWLPIVRCYAKSISSSKLDWCGHHVVDDLNRFRPRAIMTIGSPSLGFLCHKSNAQEWGGKVLRYRGWPDHWLTNPDFAKERVRPPLASVKTETKITGHPIFGPVPDWIIPIVPVQHPRIILAARDESLKKRWFGHIKRAVHVAVNGPPETRYDWPWYEFTDNVDRIKEVLLDLAKNPTRVSFDTETTGLRPFDKGAKIVSVMLRWSRNGEPRSIGFMWDFKDSPMEHHIDELTPYLLNALYASKLCGHNLTFDILFVFGTLKGVSLERLTDAMRSDTWHQAFVLRQEKGIMSLDMMATKWAPILSGYEEAMELLIELMPDLLHPDNGGHYAKCPPDKVQSHFKPYVMGDVEVTDRTTDALEKKLVEADRYAIPLSDPNRRGRFREYMTPSRNDVYFNLIAPASRVLTRMMGRGLFVDMAELEYQEQAFPEKILELSAKLEASHDDIREWAEKEKIRMSTQVQGKGLSLPFRDTVESAPEADGKVSRKSEWTLDLESKGHIKTILFDRLKIPIKEITPAGQREFPDYEKSWKSIPYDAKIKYAAVDKFTLNAMAVDNPQVRPLIEYRGIFKQYSSYVRPIRNCWDDRIDDKKTSPKHLCPDGLVHAQFLITGTRSGRLSSRNPNLQQIPADGMIKRLYTSRFGRERGIMYQADLSQIELRLIAMACGDEHMVKAYNEDIDLHSLSMSRIFNLPYEHCVKDYVSWLQKEGRMKEAKEKEMERKISKTINFLTGYGGGAHGLQSTLASDAIYKPIEECENFLTAFFDAYPALRVFLGRYKAWIMDNGCAVSILGRVRYFEETQSSDPSLQNKAQRAGCNHVIQATASDIMLSALVAIESLMRDEGLESILISTVHDSLLIDGVREELPKIHEIVMEVLNNIPEVLSVIFPNQDLSWTKIVPYSGDAEFGLNYMDMIKIKTKDNDWDKWFSMVDAEAT